MAPTSAPVPLAVPPTPVAQDPDLHHAAGLLATGLLRALARRHGWNESLLSHVTQVGVASGDQTRISPNTPPTGASEKAP
jgi:hypothetical protein